MWICYEGPEHTGKSTGIKFLEKALTDKTGREILVTKEPGSPHEEVCVKLRRLLLDPKNDVSDKTALFLFLADRAQHMKKVIRPALKEGKIVISDRSSLSTLFYYAAANQDIGEDEITRLYGIISYAQGEIKPDLCLIAGADYEWAKKSIVSRAELDRIELKGDSFHKRVHQLFNGQEEYSDNAEPGFVARNLYKLPRIPEATSEQVTCYALEKVMQVLKKVE